MKQYFIKKDRNPALILFFAGWGMDYHPFLSLNKSGYDCCICYDYNDLNFDISLYISYPVIDVYGWSMGVWVASQVLQNCNLPIRKSIAINGTIHPIDMYKGIPPNIFQGTIHFLDENNLLKFNKRMCGSEKCYQAFKNGSPFRSVDSLKTELITIQEKVTELPVPQYKWNKAFIGRNDLIFSMKNQQNAWRETGYEIIEEAHYLDFVKYV